MKDASTDGNRCVLSGHRKEPKRSGGLHASLPTDLSWEADPGICVAITDGVPGSKSTVSWTSMLRAHLV